MKKQQVDITQKLSVLMQSKNPSQQAAAERLKDQIATAQKTLTYLKKEFDQYDKLTIADGWTLQNQKFKENAIEEQKQILKTLTDKKAAMDQSV